MSLKKKLLKYKNKARERVYEFVDPDTRKRAYAIEEGMPVHEATWRHPVDPKMKAGFAEYAKKVRLGGFKKGGKVKQTGMYTLHKGERVLTSKQTKKYERARKKVFGV